MTKAQKKRVKELVEKDCEIRHCYCDFNGKTCVIGRLLKEVSHRINHDDSKHQIIDLRPELNLLQTHYGLDTNQSNSLQLANEGLMDESIEDSIEDRRARVLSTLESFPTTD